MSINSASALRGTQAELDISRSIQKIRDKPEVEGKVTELTGTINGLQNDLMLLLARYQEMVESNIRLKEKLQWYQRWEKEFVDYAGQ